MIRHGILTRVVRIRPTLTLGCALVLGSTWGCAQRTVKVRQYGEMHKVLSGGAAAAKPHVTLAQAMKEPHAYGVGALPGLEGEITVLDGKAYIARSHAGGIRVDGPETRPTDSAAMLTVAHVDKWNVFKTNKALDQQGLEKFIAKCARLDGLDVEKPFPFVLQGKVTDLATHVLNGACPMRPGAKLAADEQPWRYQSNRPMQAKIVGFYAADAVGKLTHAGTSVHAHALFDFHGVTTTAHVERMAVAPGATLRLPATN